MLNISAISKKYAAGFLLLVCLSFTEINSQSFKSQFFDANGVKIHYIDQGQGEAVLLLHGFSVDMQMWVQTGVVDSLLNNGFRVIAYDARGHGLSGKPHEPEQYGGKDILDAIAILDHLLLEKAHIVGYSRGSSIANRVRAKYPERCKTVTLGGYGITEKGGDITGRLNIDLIADSLAAGNAGPLLRPLSPPGQELNAEQLKGFNQMLVTYQDPLALAAAFRAGVSYKTSDNELQKNQIPTLALIGSDDPMIEDVKAMGLIMNKLKVVVLPGADHLSALAFPGFTMELLRFVREN